MARDQDQQLTVRVPSELRDELARIAAKERRSLSDVVRIASEDYLARRAMGSTGWVDKKAIAEWINGLWTTHPELVTAFLQLTKAASDEKVERLVLALAAVLSLVSEPVSRADSRSAQATGDR
jgi:predicted transcriptional regulator